MSRKPKVTKNLSRYDGSGLTKRNVETLKNEGTLRQRIIVVLGMLGLTAEEMAAEKIILSMKKGNKPITSRAITREMLILSRKTGIKFRISDLNYLSQVIAKYKRFSDED